MATSPGAAEAGASTGQVKNPKVLMKTNKGDIVLELFRDQAPKTVENFIELAEGRKEFTDPESGEKVKRPFFDGLIFHRVIENFMIQGGDPEGDGTGGPGYQFEDEINAKALGLHEMKALEAGQPHPYLLIRSQDQFQQMVLVPIFKQLDIKSQEELDSKRDEVQKAVETLTLYEIFTNLGYEYDEDLESSKPERGVIAMANRGPNTNGSQFFINLVDTPHLTGKHTVFGKVVEGMDVVDAIGKVPTNAQSKPNEPIRIESVRVLPGQS